MLKKFLTVNLLDILQNNPKNKLENKKIFKQ